MSNPTPPVENKPPVETQAKAEPGWGEVMVYPLAAVVALVGAGIGAVVVKWAWEANFYALPAVGVLAGWATSFASRKANWWVGAIAGVMALVVGVYAQWKFCSHFREDPGFEYFISHIMELPNFVLLLHGVSVGLAVWLGSRK